MHIHTTELDLKGNKISVVPVAVGQLSNLTMLALDTENITSPPKEIIAAGTTVMVDYLRRLFESKVHMYVCVCLLKALAPLSLCIQSPAQLVASSHDVRMHA
jgi:Leucine-rich repeat (LRR) protein